MKEHCEVYGFCGSKYSSSDTNMLNSLKNSLIKSINNHGKFPKYIVLVLDTDLVDYPGFEGTGMVTLLGDMVEWLTKNFCSWSMTDLKYFLLEQRNPVTLRFIV